MQLAAREAYPIWAPSYDADPNPVVALERRVVEARLPALRGAMVLDVAAGTGRWTGIAASLGARVIGLDLCREMLSRSTVGNRIQADMRAIPLADGCVDLALCSLAMGYVRSIDVVFREMARVAHRVIVSDLHPDAVNAGWTRSFSVADKKFEIQQYLHTIDDYRAAACGAGLVPEWTAEACFGAEERHLFEKARRADLFANARAVNAIFAASWVRP